MPKIVELVVRYVDVLDIYPAGYPASKRLTILVEVKVGQEFKPRVSLIPYGLWTSVDSLKKHRAAVAAIHALLCDSRPSFLGSDKVATIEILGWRRWAKQYVVRSIPVISRFRPLNQLTS